MTVEGGWRPSPMVSHGFSFLWPTSLFVHTFCVLLACADARSASAQVSKTLFWRYAAATMNVKVSSHQAL